MIEGARCPVHNAPATDACGRCGRFVCVTCQRLRDTDVFCEACRPLVAEAKPLGGWLIVAGATLMIAPLRLLTTLGDVWTSVREQSLELLFELQGGRWLLLAAWDLFAAAVTTAVALVALPHFLARRAVAVAWMKRFFAANLGLALATAIVGRVLGEEEGWMDPAPVVGAIASVLWLHYFTRAARVQATFVR